MIQLSSGLLLYNSPVSRDLVVLVVCLGELSPGIQYHLCRLPEEVPPLAPTTSCSQLCRQKEGDLLRTPMPWMPLVSSSDHHGETIYPKGLSSLALSRDTVDGTISGSASKGLWAPYPPRPPGDSCVHPNSSHLCKQGPSEG